MQRYLIIVLLPLLAHVAVAQAQSYPVRPVRVIVTQTAGSSMDVLARMVAPKMADMTGQQFVIDNRGGAAGVIGAQIGATAPADGYTLVFSGASSLVITTFTYRKVGFDPLEDFEPISLVVAQEALLVVTPNAPMKNVKDLIAVAKASAGKLNMASAGTGSSGHLAGVMFTTLAGIDSVHVAYKGGGPMALAIISGESQWGVGLVASFMGHVKAGRLRRSRSRRSSVRRCYPTCRPSTNPAFRDTIYELERVLRAERHAALDREHGARHGPEGARPQRREGTLHRATDDAARQRKPRRVRPILPCGFRARWEARPGRGHQGRVGDAMPGASDRKTSLPPP